MSGNFLHSITQSLSIRQTGTLPNVMVQAEVPKQPLPTVYEGIEGKTTTDWAVILTALVVEHKAVEAHLQPFGQLTRLSEEIHPSGTVYTQGHFQANGCTWNVAVVQIDMGNVSAGVEAIRAIEQFKPRVILFVGVAGGIKDVKIGDVVAASIVYGYECGKIFDDRTLPRPKLGEADYDLKQRAQAESRKDDWRAQIRSGSTTSETIPSVYVKPIAAGEKVIASQKSVIYDYLREYYDDAIAVEMEGFGFLKATQQVKNVSAIVIRGISNLIEDKNDASVDSEQIRQEKAASHASAFAFTLLAKLDGEKIVERSEVHQTIAQVTFDSTLPEGTISLNVQALMENNLYFIHAHHGKKTFASRGKIEQSVLNLHQHIENSLAVDNLLSTIDDCNARVRNSDSCLAGKLLKWLLKENDSSDKIECLIIDEHTDFEIPWELLEVGKKPIGVSFQTVRKQQNEVKEISMNSCCGGGVLIYAHAEYGGWQRYHRQHFTVFQEFLRHMQKTEVDFGLVFIDGFSVEESLKSSPTAYIKRSKLFKCGTSIVFVSGQLNLDASIGLNHRTLLTNFLEHGAKGIVEAWRCFDRARAQEVVDNFSDAHKQHPEWTVPEILRRLRESVWETLNNEVNENTCAAYLATFLHIYYGNPMISLQLTFAKGESND
jgi:nucleoside phosphorylase